jgi:hypothetical protein
LIQHFEPVAIYGKHEHEQAFLHFIIVMSISMPTAAPISSSSFISLLKPTMN